MYAWRKVPGRPWFAALSSWGGGEGRLNHCTIKTQRLTGSNTNVAQIIPQKSFASSVNTWRVTTSKDAFVVCVCDAYQSNDMSGHTKCQEDTVGSMLLPASDLLI